LKQEETQIPVIIETPATPENNSQDTETTIAIIKSVESPRSRALTAKQKLLSFSRKYNTTKVTTSTPTPTTTITTNKARKPIVEVKAASHRVPQVEKQPVTGWLSKSASDLPPKGQVKSFGTVAGSPSLKRISVGMNRAPSPPPGRIGSDLCNTEDNKTKRCSMIVSESKNVEKGALFVSPFMEDGRTPQATISSGNIDFSPILFKEGKYNKITI
jgi:hypothetical protein